MNKFFIVVATAVVIFSQGSLAAVPQAQIRPSKNQFKVNMRLGLKGGAPISINTVTKSGKKTFISEFSDDGQNETLVELYTRRSQVNRKEGLYIDVTVTKRVRGQKKSSERAQVFAPDNQEMEFGMNSKGRTAGNLSVAVMAHQL